MKNTKKIKSFGGWAIYHSSNIINIIPLNDLKPHDMKDCWCKPDEDGAIRIHNSMDERESYESGRKLQ